MPKNPGNSKYVKKLNRMTVLNIIKENEPISRKQLADLTGLTPPAITGIMRELLELGFVKEVGLGKSHGGRKPVKLTFNPEAGYVIGIEITRMETTIAVADLKNDPEDKKTIGIDMTEPETGLAGLADVVTDLIKSRKYAGKRFLGIGIAFPGLLHSKTCVVKRSVNLGPKWSGFPVKEFLERKLEMPVFVEHNSTASALAERWFGGGTDCKDLIYINLGEGISAGIITDDHILQGSQGYAGEIGHIALTEEGPLCNCGNRGCLESLCGIPALVKRANAELSQVKPDDPLKKIWLEKNKVSIDNILATASYEGGYSAELLRQAGKYVGLAVSYLINLFNPEMIFIGGKLALASDTFMDILKDTANAHAFPEIATSTQIKVSAFNGNASVIGACALALRELFKSNSGMLDGVRLKHDGI